VDAYEAEREALLRAFGERLKALREARVGTQEELAFAAKLHRTHISLLERGKREPSLTTLLILAETLEVPIQKLSQGLAVPVKRRPERRRKGRARP
jgi:transcriptional regulator with XRE-family HTH domain